jgi:hypothetical protein
MGTEIQHLIDSCEKQILKTIDIEPEKNKFENAPAGAEIHHVVIYMNLNAEPMRKFSFCLDHSKHQDLNDPSKVLDRITLFIRNIIWVNWMHDATFGKPSGMPLFHYFAFCVVFLP